MRDKIENDVKRDERCYLFASFVSEAAHILLSSVGYASPKTQRRVKTDPVARPPAI